MMTSQKDNLIVGATARIVSAYVKHNSLSATELSTLLGCVNSALQAAAQISRPEIAKPVAAVPIKRSVQRGGIICLECGLEFKSLKRHLSVHHQLSPNEYRAKWDVPPDYPMVAPDYALRRSKIAQEMGLGRRAKATPARKSRAGKR